MLTLRRVLCLSFLGLGLGVGLGACYRPGDLGDTPYLCTSARPACPDGYVCAVSLGTCVRKSASSRQAVTGAKAGAAAATSGSVRGEGCSAGGGKDELPEAEGGLLDEGFGEGGDGQDVEVETAATPIGCGSDSR